MDFTSLVKPEERIKQNLHPLFVLEQNNIDYTQDGVRFKAVSPFRNDKNPSLDIFWSEDQSQWRVGDFAESWQGDVLDLVQRLLENTHHRALKFKTIVDAGINYLKAQEDSGWKGPDPDDFITESFDYESALLRFSTATSRAPLLRFLADKSNKGELGIATVPVAWIQEQWKVVCDDETILIPYYKEDGSLPAYKWRMPEGGVRSASGSRLRGSLYGEWREASGKSVLLVESESDAWTASYYLPQFHVLAMSAGAGTQYRPYSYLKGKPVTLCFDGDAAGRAGMVKWAQSLIDWASSVSVVPIPDGRDLSSLKPEQLTDLVNNAMAFTSLPAAVTIKHQQYFRTVNDYQLSDWVFLPTRTLRDDRGGYSYEGTILPCHRKAILQQADMIDSKSLVRWANRHGYAWSGGNADCQSLSMLLRHMSPFLPVGYLTNCIGLSRDHWVMPDESLGPDYVRYVPPETGAIDFRSGLYWDTPCPEDNILTILDSLRGMHDHSVTDPILAWMAVAPLRVKFKRFPTLTVTGPSGSGKTTIVETMLRLFSGSIYTTNLTSTTPFAIFSFVKSSRGFPIWFDEYRFGARPDAKQTLDQILRDAYTGQPSAKGGATQNKMEVTLMQTLAPLVITGEESFSETSHTDRSILVSMPLRGKNITLYQWLVEQNTLAPHYVDWLLIDDEHAWPETVNTDRVNVQGLNDRQKINLGVLEFGWKLLNEWRKDLGGQPWGPMDASLITQEAQEAALGDPVTDAVLWALQQDDYKLAFFDTAQHFGSTARPVKAFVRIDNLIAEINKRGLFLVPGGAKAATKALIAKYNAKVETVAVPVRNEMFGGRKVRAVAIAVEACTPLMNLVKEHDD